MTIPRRNADDVIELLDVTKGGGSMASMPMAIKHMVNVYRFGLDTTLVPDSASHVVFELGHADTSLVHLDVFCIDEEIKFNVVEIDAIVGFTGFIRPLAVDAAKNTVPSKTKVGASSTISIKAGGKHPDLITFNNTNSRNRTRIFDCADMDCFRMAANKSYALTLTNTSSRHVRVHLDGILVEEAMKMPMP